MTKINGIDICLADSATTHTIIKTKIYFTHLVMEEVYVSTIIGSTKMSKGFGRATILFLDKKC